jgi:hypothetical protein
MRIIPITIATLIVTCILVMMARIWGLGQTYTSYENAFFNGSTPLIVAKADTLQEAEENLKLAPDTIIWVDVRFSRDQVAFVLDPTQDSRFLENRKQLQEKNPETPIMVGAKISEYPWEQINEFYSTTPALREYYERFPKTRFILNMVDNVSEAHQILVKSIEDLKPNGRTFIQSDALILMTAVKELKPEWVYGTSVPDLMRLMTFDSMFILPSTQFKGDVFLAPFLVQKRKSFNDDIMAEMRRRHKRVFLGPISNKAELEVAQKYQAEGLITENLPELLKLLGQGPAQ